MRKKNKKHGVDVQDRCRIIPYAAHHLFRTHWERDLDLRAQPQGKLEKKGGNSPKRIKVVTGSKLTKTHTSTQQHV